MALAAAAPDAPAVPVTLVHRAMLNVAVVTALGSRFGAQRSVLPFGLKAGHYTVRVETNTWTPRDSGRYPVVVIAPGGPAALEQPFPEYLASHGYTVVRAPAGHAEAAGAAAIITWDVDSSAVATVERAGRGPAAPRLSIRLVRRGDPRSARLRVVLPELGNRPGAESRGYRTLCAITQAILNATLEGVHPTLTELADRLRAAGMREAYIRAS